MSILSTRITMKEINISPDGRNHGDIQVLFELARGKIIVREIKTMHTAVKNEFELSSPDVSIDTFTSSEFGSKSGFDTALAGGILFGVAGAAIGGALGKGRNFWICEIKNGSDVFLYKFDKDSDVKVLQKHIKKYQ